MSFRSGALDGSWWIALLALAAVFALFEFTQIDLWVQDFCYDFQRQRWLLDTNAFWPRVVFYTGPKVVLIVFGLAAFVLALGRTRWRKRLSSPPLRRRDLLVLVGVLASGPALIAFGKATTNVFCPNDIRRYGGDVPYVAVCSPYPQNDQPTKRGVCFPAGHASGGFALLSLAGLARTARGRRIGIAIGLCAGSVMGAYQMLKGAHYLSHTLITALVCWLMFLLWRRILGANDGFETS